MEDTGKCCTEEFKTELSELCQDCPIRQEIADWANVHLVPYINETQSVFSGEALAKEFNTEIKEHLRLMRKISKAVPDQTYHNKNQVPKFSKNYIQHKEVIKALKGFLDDLERSDRGPGGNKRPVIKKEIGAIMEVLKPLYHEDGPWPPESDEGAGLARALFNNLHSRQIFGKVLSKSKMRCAVLFSEEWDIVTPDSLCRTGGVRYSKWTDRIERIISPES